ncbi:MAG: HAMP domain-containing histidine kinase [Gammaproteobacteria bacterium]|nr:HAMP domain-containing histidine kinase [Gammaproteobacteria bacterium]
MRVNLFHTTAFRLSAGYTLLLTLAVGITLGSAYLLTGRLVTAEVDLIIDTELKSLEEKFARSGVAGVTDEINLRTDSWGRIGAVYLLADANFERIAGNVTEWPFEGMPTERWPEFEIETIEPGRRALHPVRAAIRHLPGGDLLLVGTDISQGRGFAEQFRIATLWGVGLSTLAAALAGFWFSFRLARRVDEVADTCQRIMAGESGRRLPVAGARDEFDALAGAVNRVLDRLEEQARTLRATFDSAAHDLRAPLHRLRTRLESLLRRTPPVEAPVHDSLEAGLREIEHLQRTLATLLQIALAESGTALAAPADVDIAQLAAELTELFEPVAAQQGLTLASVLQGPALVRGNRQLLAQLLTNLIENGLKYVPAGGRIELAVRALADGVRLSVSDDGPGIDAALRARAGQPFVRLGGAAQEGSGLGLSLVAAIVRLHRGRLELQGNDPGLRVVVELPAAA